MHHRNSNMIIEMLTLSVGISIVIIENVLV
jgi:hypothetical protein